MIRSAGTPDLFEVDFSKARRKRKPALGQALESMLARAPAPVAVDGLAIAQAICAAMDACTFEDVAGRPWLWNEYVMFLSRADHDRLRDVEEPLRADLMTLLNEEMVRRDARLPEAFVVRLLVDEADEIRPGFGTLRVRHRKDVQGGGPVVAGEITVRGDRIATKPRNESSTERQAGLRLVCPDGAVALPEGRRVVVGRAADDAGADHLSLPAAGTRVNRRQAALLVRGAEVEVTRERGANPVEVAGQVLAEGASVRAALPAELVLSNGAWRGTVCR